MRLFRESTWVPSDRIDVELINGYEAANAKAVESRQRKSQDDESSQKCRKAV